MLVIDVIEFLIPGMGKRGNAMGLEPLKDLGTRYNTSLIRVNKKIINGFPGTNHTNMFQEPSLTLPYLNSPNQIKLTYLNFLIQPSIFSLPESQLTDKFS